MRYIISISFKARIQDKTHIALNCFIGLQNLIETESQNV